MKKIGSTKHHGTIITFQPDPTIFPTATFDFKRVVDHLRQQAYLVKGLRITIIDAREAGRKSKDDETFYLRDLGLEAPSMSFYFEGGLISLVRFRQTICRSRCTKIFSMSKRPPTTTIRDRRSRAPVRRRYFLAHFAFCQQHLHAPKAACMSPVSRQL